MSALVTAMKNFWTKGPTTTPLFQLHSAPCMVLYLQKVLEFSKNLTYPPMLPILKMAIKKQLKKNNWRKWNSHVYTAKIEKKFLASEACMKKVYQQFPT